MLQCQPPCQMDQLPPPPVDGGDRFRPRVLVLYCFVKVYTVIEGHVLYPSRWTVSPYGETGRSAHDPRGQHTRISPARHGAGERAGQRDAGLPGIRYLPHPVLPLAKALLGLRPGWAAPPSARGPTRAAANAQPPGRTGHPGSGSGVADLGSGPTLQPVAPSGTRWPARRRQYDLPPAAADGAADALGASGRARSPQRSGGRVADRTYQTPAGRRSATPGATHPGDRARGSWCVWTRSTSAS